MTNHHQTTTYQPVETNHLLHLVLSLVTCGFWLPVWGLVAVINHGRTKRLTTVGSYSPYVGMYRPSAVYPPYEVGPGAPVGPMNPAPPGPPAPKALMSV
jgi:hypothetical protein